MRRHETTPTLRLLPVVLGFAILVASCSGEESAPNTSAALAAETDATAVTLSLGIVDEPEPTVVVEKYSDVEADLEIGAAVAFLESRGMDLACNPPENSKVCPSRTLRRGEGAAIIASAFGLVDEGEESPFEDIAGHAFEKSINALSQAGAAIACPEGYCPGEPLIRGEAIATILVAGATSDPGEVPDAFTDDNGYQFESLINAAAFLGIVTGSGDEEPIIEHEEPVQRRHVIIMLYRLLNPTSYESGSHQPEQRLGHRYRCVAPSL